MFQLTSDGYGRGYVSFAHSLLYFLSNWLFYLIYFFENLYFQVRDSDQAAVYDAIPVERGSHTLVNYTAEKGECYDIKQTLADNVDPERMQQNASLIRVYTVCIEYRNV